MPSKKRKLHYPRKWSWPKGAKICVSLNMALESFVRASQVTLEKTAKSGNAEATSKLVADIGRQTCGGCHTAFRGPEIKK